MPRDRAAVAAEASEDELIAARRGRRQGGMRHRRPAEPGRPRAHDPVGGDEDPGPVLRDETVDPRDDLRL